MSDLVSVIVPAYNGAATIDETLHSVRAQTWRDLEILVIDDGSTDNTAQLVLKHAGQDARVRLIRKDNGGVAAARNLGIAEAGGNYIAPVDADDLWRPTKIQKQMALMRAGGDRIGLVYTWFAVIDESGGILRADNSSSEEGDVLRRMCQGNLVGNGSSPLMRKAAVLEAGGYDPSLRERGAQGCEDLKLYFEIARRHHFAVVRELLTGYRWSPNAMSRDGVRMLRSYDLVMNPFKATYGEVFGSEFAYGRGFIVEWLMRRAIQTGNVKEALILCGELRKTHTLKALAAAMEIPFALMRKRRGATAPGGPLFLGQYE